MPMDNYHSGRVKDPNDFMEGKKYWATLTLKNTDGIQLVTGKLKDDGAGGPMTAQAYHFPKDKYTEKQAKDWLKKRKIKTILFEPAKKEVAEMTTSMAANVGVVTPAILGFDNAWDSVTKKKKKKKNNPNDEGDLEEQEVVASVSGDEYTFKGSFEWIRGLVQDALKAEKKYGQWPSIICLFPDKVYIDVYDDMQSTRRYFEIEYELDEEEELVYLGNATEIEKKTDWIIKEQAEKIASGLFPMVEILDEALKGVNDLPDSSFGFIEDGGEKDEDGKTKPRKLRHYPMKDADGNWEKGNVVNALTRLNQATKESSPWMTDAAKAKILAMIKKGYKALDLEFPE